MESRDEVVIVPYSDGPYLVRGPVVMRDQQGRPIALSRRTDRAVSLWEVPHPSVL